MSPLLPAVCFVIFGFYQSIIPDPSKADFYNLTVHLFNWTLRGGAVLFLSVVFMCGAGLTLGLLIDSVVSAICAAVFVIVGVNWSSHGFINGYLCLLFALMFGGAARHQFMLWKDLTREKDMPEARAFPVEPVHPASIHPEVMPKADEPPPEEGYLARLAREKRESRGADHE